MGTLYNYSIDDSSKNNSSIGAIYDIITRFTLNDSLNKEEFIKYVQSTSIYQKYGLMANPINDEKSLIYQYYIPYTDIFITTANTSDGTLPMFNIAYVESTASRKSPSQLQIDIIFNVPVEAEGMTKK